MIDQPIVRSFVRLSPRRFTLWAGEATDEEQPLPQDFPLAFMLHLRARP